MSLDRFITTLRGVWLVIMCIEIPVLNANIVDADQTPHSAASDRGLLCLLMSLLFDARHKWVNTRCFFYHVYKDCLIVIVGFPGYPNIYFNRS